MHVQRLFIYATALTFCAVKMGPAWSQAYPLKPIRIITADAGGSVDFASRLLAQGLGAALGQPVFVDNRPSGAIPQDIVAKAAPDGYTLLYYSSLLWLLPFLQDKLPYDPLRDFSPISLTTSSFSVLVIHPSLPVISVKALIALARARPGELNYASTSTGSSPHLAAELFKAMAGVNIVRVNYKGSAQGLNDLIGGQVQVMFPNAVGVAPHVKSGRLRALAITAAQPSALLPALPTVAAAGLPGYESLAIIGFLGPAKLPDAIINRLNEETVRVLNRTDIREKFSTLGVDIVASSPEQLAAMMKSEMARMGKVIKDAGIRGE